MKKIKHLDKNSLKHFGVNFVAGLCGLFGLGVGVGASVTKEYCDYKACGHWCWVDIVVDALGLLCGQLIYWFLLA